MPGRAPLVNLRLHPEEFAREVFARAAMSEIHRKVRSDLVRYYNALTRARVNLDFTPEEAIFIVQQLRDKENIGVREAKLLRYDLGHSAELIKPSGIDLEAFLDKLASLALIDWLAIVDAVERYVLAAKREVEIPEKLVRYVGLTRD